MMTWKLRSGNGAYDKPPAKPNVAHTSRCTKGCWGGVNPSRDWNERGMTSHRVQVQVACPYRLASNFKALSSALNYNNTAERRRRRQQQ